MFIDNFNTFLNNLKLHTNTDEWYMVKFVDKYIKTLETYEAFDALKQFIVYMIENYDEEFEYEILEILRYLKYQADTNEHFYTDEQKDKVLELYKDEYSQEILAEVL